MKQPPKKPANCNSTPAEGALACTDARPDFAELDVFLGQHILLTLEQHFNPKM